jgi:hypothetical protein
MGVIVLLRGAAVKGGVIVGEALDLNLKSQI